MERLTLDDMIKALKCVASQDTEGDCYADHENFMHMQDDEHKRIICGTGEDLRDYISGKEVVGCPYHQNTYGCSFEDGELYWLKDAAELLEELKSYKGLEEQGLLVRLPVKIETELFQPCADCKSIIRSIVINNTITDDDIYIGIIDERGNERHYSKKSIGKTVFLTREEAEKKLDEIQNDKT